MEHRLETTISLIRQTIPKEVYNRLTKQKLFPEGNGVESDLKFIANALSKWNIKFQEVSVYNIQQIFRETLEQTFSPKKQEELLKQLVLCAISINNIRLKRILLHELVRYPNGISELFEVFELLDGFQQVLLLLSKKSISDDKKIDLSSSKYYRSLYPLIEMDDSFLSYLYILELGRFVLDYFATFFKFDKQLVMRSLDYIISSLSVQNADQDLTDLQKCLIVKLKDYFLIDCERDPFFEFQMEKLGDIMADFLNAKVWLLKTYLSAMGVEENTLEVSDIGDYDLLEQIISELLTPSLMSLFSLYYPLHPSFVWSEFEIDRPVSQGMIEFLVSTIFELVNQGTVLQPIMFEGMFELLMIPAMDFLKTRNFLLSSIIFSNIEMTFSIQSQILKVFNNQLNRAKEKLDDDAAIFEGDITNLGDKMSLSELEFTTSVVNAIKILGDRL